MKKHERRSVKLQLTRETVRRLQEDALTKVVAANTDGWGTMSRDGGCEPTNTRCADCSD